MDPEEHSRYRPVSNLTYLSKIMEKVVSTRLDKHMNDNHLHEPLQSTYRVNHSTETALLTLRCKMTFKLLMVIWLQCWSFWTSVQPLIQMTLLRCLSHEFAIKGNARKWFQSYLTGRTQAVTIGSETSTSQALVLVCPRTLY